MWMFWYIPEFCSWDSEFSKRNPFVVLCNEDLNYEHYIEKCIGDKECSVCYKSHTGHFSKYYIKAKQFLFLLKQDCFQNYHVY